MGLGTVARLGAMGVVVASTLVACATSGTSAKRPTPSGYGAPTATLAPTASSATATTAGYPVRVFFSKHPDSDSNVAAVFPVSRVAPTLGVATYATQQLIAGPTSTEAAQGYYTPLTGAITGSSNCGGADFQITLNMKGSTPETGTATLRFCRSVMLAGDLTGGYITAEIKSTLTQFPNIQKVVILTSAGSCFDDLSGMNACLK